MKDQELKKLSRRELLELLVDLSRENDTLRSRIQKMEQLLSDRRIKMNHAGSIAEAALQLNHVFEAAQQAADQYLENIRSLHDRQEQIRSQTKAEPFGKTQPPMAGGNGSSQAMEAEAAETLAPSKKSRMDDPQTEPQEDPGAVVEREANA